jgi:hypothetical protein
MLDSSDHELPDYFVNLHKHVEGHSLRNCLIKVCASLAIRGGEGVLEGAAPSNSPFSDSF